MKMNDAVQAKLKEIVARYGSSVIDDPLRCQGLLNDLCPASRREVASLILVLKQGVPWELAKAGKNTPRQAISTRLVKQVTDNIGLSEDVARWAVESWARAVESLPPAALARHQTTPPTQAQPAKPIKPIKPARLTKPTTAPQPLQAPLTMPGKQTRNQGLTLKAVLDTVQRPVVLISLAVSIVAVLYLVFLSAPFGWLALAVSVLVGSAILSVVSFVMLYPKTKGQLPQTSQKPKLPAVNPPPAKPNP